MRALVRGAVGTLFVLLAGAAGAFAQDDATRAIGRPVTAVRFEIEGRPVVSPELEAEVPIELGEPLRLDAVRDAESHLINFNRGLYEDVQVFVANADAGVALIFRLTPRHPVDRIEYTGQTGLAASELDALVRERFGGIPAREQPGAVAQAVETLLRDEGYPDARVQPRVEVTHDPDRATLFLDVAAGRRPLIVRTEVKGNSPLPARRVMELTETQPGRPFRLRVLEPRLITVGDELRKRGYYGAVATLQNEPQLSASEGGWIVTLLVDAGPRVTLQWDPVESQPPGDAEDYVPMRRQQSVDEDLLEDSDQRVASYWRRQGYKDVKVTHTRDVQGDQLIVTMHIDRGLRYRIADLQITGSKLPPATVRATFGIQAGGPYDPEAISAGIARLKQSYLVLGYHRVTIKELDPEEVPGSRTATDVRLVVQIDVSEGPEVHVGVLTISGAKTQPVPAVQRLLLSQPGTPYVVAYLQRDRNEVESYYTNLGYENVDVTIVPTPSADGRSMNLAVNIQEGPQIIVGRITITGNRSVSEQAIKQVLTIREGQPFGDATRRESSRRLYEMGVFRQVSIEEEPRTSGEIEAHVIVTVQELPATSISFGAGLEGDRRPLRDPDGTSVDRIVIAPRGLFEIGRRNLWGKNRSVDFYSRVAPQLARTTGGNFGFLEYRVSGTYREPRAFGSTADLTVAVASEQASRIGFNFARQSAAAQAIRRVTSHVTVTGRYGLEYTRLFDIDIDPLVRPIIDRLFPQVRLSLLSSGVLWDRRDDPVAPAHGTLSTADFEMAPRALGSEVGYAKVFLQSSGFHALTASKRVVVAGRAQVGMARGFERTAIDTNGQQTIVADLPASQRFFAGGSTTVRGFQLDRLGVPSILTSDGLSVGGNGVVVLNAELRTTLGKLLGRDFGAAVFTDSGNVFARAGDIDMSELRTTYGLGFRYNSPLGPVRLDVGFKTDRRQLGTGRESAWEYHFNIGEAF